MRYLKARGGKWHYVRRVPSHLAALDPRGTIRTALKTASLDVAKLRRDAMERADDLFWQGMSLDGSDKSTHGKYQAAKARAVALGFEYKGAVEIADTSPVEEIIRRVTAATKSHHDELAALGGVDEPKLTVRKAMELYTEELADDELLGMSTGQIESWKKVKFISVGMFEEVCGTDKVLLELTRADANKFHKHLMTRIKTEGISGNTANRRLGNVRKLFRVYAAHLQLDLKNPFDGLSFSDPKRLRDDVLPFEVDYVKSKFLSIDPDDGYALSGMNLEARCIFLITLETGCRPSEIANLKPENIHLKAKVPYISVRFEDDRRLKTENSIRDVPLIGVALEAMRLFPKGFPRYRDKETNLSGAVMNYLKDNKLLPTKNHRAYSMRHTYEKRMVEAGYDDEYRRRMLGHDTDRPEYGDGGSLAWRAERMTAIALPYDPEILTIRERKKKAA